MQSPLPIGPAKRKSRQDPEPQKVIHPTDNFNHHSHVVKVTQGNSQIPRLVTKLICPSNVNWVSFSFFTQEHQILNRFTTKVLLPATLVLSIGVLAFAQPATAPKNPQPRGEPERAPAPGEPGTPRRGPGGPNAAPANLEGAMKLMNGSLKRLKTQIADSTKKDDNLKLVNEAQRGAVIAKGMDTTEAFSKQPDAAKRAKMNADYRPHMIQLVEHLLTLEKQIIADKTEDASKTLDLLKAYRTENHEAFGVED